MPLATHIVAHLNTVLHGESALVQLHYHKQVVDQEIWLWDEERQCHVRTTEEDLNKVLRGWEAEVATFPRVLLPVTLQAHWFPTRQHTAA